MRIVPLVRWPPALRGSAYGPAAASCWRAARPRTRHRRCPSASGAAAGWSGTSLGHLLVGLLEDVGLARVELALHATDHVVADAGDHAAFEGVDDDRAVGEVADGLLAVLVVGVVVLAAGDPVAHVLGVVPVEAHGFDLDGLLAVPGGDHWLVSFVLVRAMTGRDLHGVAGLAAAVTGRRRLSNRRMNSRSLGAR